MYAIRSYYAATHFGEAAELLDALAQIDAGACGERPMSAAALRVLAPARQANLLRWQLRRMDLTMPDETRLTEALRQLNTCDPARPLLPIAVCPADRSGGVEQPAFKISASTRH